MRHDEMKPWETAKQSTKIKQRAQAVKDGEDDMLRHVSPQQGPKILCMDAWRHVQCGAMGKPDMKTS